MAEPYTHADFVTRALDAFPELAEDFASISDLPTLHVSIFAQRLQHAKGEGDWDAYARGVAIVDELWARPTEQLEGMLRWTFMRGLSFDGVRGPVAWSHLSPTLQRVWTATRQQDATLDALPRKAKITKGRRR